MDAQQVAHPLVAFRFGGASEDAFAPQVNAEPETSKTPRKAVSCWPESRTSYLLGKGGGDSF